MYHKANIEQLYKASKNSDKPIINFRDALKTYIEAQTKDEAMEVHMIDFAADYNDIQAAVKTGNTSYEQYMNSLEMLVVEYIEKIRGKQQRNKDDEQKQQAASKQQKLF